ncbi:MAG: hypothetical protein IJ196_07810 [Prevotella sp.]|nr:hypothetical protein [Prevotella sp.]
MAVEEEGKIQIEEYGFSSNEKCIDFNSFSKQELMFNETEKIQGRRDYMALKQGGNVYLIIDTDEIPILDVALIDEGYGEIVNNNTPLSLFKRKKVAHQYLRGYIGFHLWKSEGIDDEKESAHSYISGFNSENMQIMRSNKMDRMPRARKILILHCGEPSKQNEDIQEIENMLRFGFGRWNELMTYPFPFKFLQEYLDDACEMAFSKHWNEIIYKLS